MLVKLLVLGTLVCEWLLCLVIFMQCSLYLFLTLQLVHDGKLSEIMSVMVSCCHALLFFMLANKSYPWLFSK